MKFVTSFIRKFAGPAAACYACLGLVLHLGPKDGRRYTAPFFYATPWLLIAVGFLVAAVFLPQRKKLWLFLMLVTLICFFHRDFRLPGASSTASGAGTKVLFWNLNRPETHPKAVLLELIAEQNPDVVAVLETEGVLPAEQTTYQKLLPGWHQLFLPRQMAVFSKSPITTVSTHTVGTGSYVDQIRVEDAAGSWDLWIADINAIPTRDRFPPLKNLHQLVSSPVPTLVVGDFNTPADSKAFDTLRQDFHQGWETAGTGFCQTWPYGIPLLSLDQAWANRFWEIRGFTKGQRSWKGSDHAWIMISAVLK